MSKLRAPLFSFRASGQIAKSLVYFGWKGLNLVRSYVVPANPKTTAQNTQRGYMTAAVAEIHRVQAVVPLPWVVADQTAYSLYGSTEATPRTWFNQAIARWLISRVNSEHSQIFGDSEFTDPATTEITLELINYTNPAEAGYMHYGTSKTNMPGKVACDGVANVHTAVMTGFTKGVKYFFQFRPTKVTDDKYVMRSGIYHHVST